MKMWVGVTDKSWFEYLMRLAPDEVNFWQPSGTRNFKVLQPGEPFLFKLHSPHNFIVGGGFFVRYSALPASLAWDAFGQKNGVTSLSDLRGRVHRYRPKDDTLDPIIGCNVLVEPFFFERSNGIPIPTSFALNIVSGKSYDTQTEEGRSLWESVTDAYQRRCAVTGEKTLPVLEAAHIKPYAELGPHRVSNGILLRSDLHKLFDLGYITVTPELHLEVSPRLQEEWQNGREYYAYHGKELRCRPENPVSIPSREFLVWHNENRFKA